MQSYGWNLQGLQHTHAHAHPFNGPFSGTTRVSRYQKGKTNMDFTEARDSEWQWHQRMPVLPPNQQRQSTEGNIHVQKSRFIGSKDEWKQTDGRTRPIANVVGNCGCGWDRSTAVYHVHLTTSLPLPTRYYQWRRQDFVTGGSEVWVYRGSRVRSPPVPVVLSVYQRGSLLDGLAMYLSCDTNKFYDNESTHILDLHNFWTSTHRAKLPPSPWRRHWLIHS